MMPLVRVIDPFSVKKGIAAFAKLSWLKHLLDSPKAKSSMVNSSNVLKGALTPAHEIKASKDPIEANTSETLSKSKASIFKSGPERPARMTS